MSSDIANRPAALRIAAVLRESTGRKLTVTEITRQTGYARSTIVVMLIALRKHHPEVRQVAPMTWRWEQVQDA